MATNPLRYALKSRESGVKSVRSTVMFQGKYKDELQKTVNMIEEAIQKDLGKHFVVDSIVSGKNNLKIWIDDEEQGIQRIINCVFRHHHDDEKYGNINIDIVTSGLGTKPKLHFVGKFSVLDREVMSKKVLNNLISCVKESSGG